MTRAGQIRALQEQKRKERESFCQHPGAEARRIVGELVKLHKAGGNHRGRRVKIGPTPSWRLGFGRKTTDLERFRALAEKISSPLEIFSRSEGC